MKALRADPLSVGQIFSGHEFVIPDFQRPYSWGIEECEQLWVDISSFLDEMLDGTRDNKEQYFLGSIVVYPCEENEHVWVVIDGQQRLTTLLIFIRRLFESATTHTVLQKMLYKTDPATTEIIEDKPRLVSKVVAGGGRNDYEDFQKVINLEIDDLHKNNPFKLNHDVLEKSLRTWWADKTIEQRENALKWFRENIVMLPIVCDSLDDALTLFQIINDRGMSLNDSDIFKAKIYGMAGQQDRECFIKRWNALEEHETLFRIHMHILRSKKGDAGKEIGLRPYIQKACFENPPELETSWNSIVCSLESYHSIRTQGATCSDEFAHNEKIFWAILSQYPNIYWWYPLYVFLNKHGNQRDGVFSLAENKQEKYIALLENTVRYFFIKGIVYNAVNSVKDTTFKVCVSIANGENCISKYRENIKENDLTDFEKKLSQNNYGMRYRKGLVWLCSSLNSKQNRADYAETIEQCHIEHVLPKQWAHYDKWNDKSHEENIETIGNHIPLEWKLNIQARAEFFKRKQDRYKESKIQDALDLSEKRPSCWYPKDVKNRQQDSLDRLIEFFTAIL